MLECGLPARQMRRLCGRALTDYEACLITHGHGDHARAADHLFRVGVPVYASSGTLRELNAMQYSCATRAYPLAENTLYTLQGYLVYPAAAFHDCAEPLSFCIESRATGERLFFAVDTRRLPGAIDGFDEVAVECNYDDERLLDDGFDPSVKDRIRRNHMSTNRLLSDLRGSNLERTRLIWLLHISSERGDAEMFRRRVQDATGIETRIAESWRV
jgi:phosphoribosyl 1,2-cyclic phosphodiesterase